MNEDLSIYFSQAEDSLQAAQTLKSHGLYKGGSQSLLLCLFLDS